MSIKFAPTKAPDDWLKPEKPKLSEPPKSLIPAPEYQTTKRLGRKPSGNAKKLLTLRLDPDVVAFYRGSGEGWQTRINEILRKNAGL